MPCTATSPKCGGQMVRGECYGQPACVDASWTWLDTPKKQADEGLRTSRRKGPCHCGHDPCRCR